MLYLIDASLFIGGKLLIADANLSINPGDRIGIAGRNGCGKSHLMKLLSGDLQPDMGERKLTRGKVLLVNQDLPDETQTPLDYLRALDPDLLSLETSLNECSPDEVCDITDQLTELEDARYTVLAPKVLRGLGLTDEELVQPMKHLSGGLRMRIGLAMALIRTPDVLLLDEPTNHLDLESTQWLIEFLKNYPSSSAFVIVTHDMKLLNEVTTSTIHLRCGFLTSFAGTYELYKTNLAAREKQDERKNAVLTSQIERHKEIYYKFRKLPAKRAAQAVAQLKRAEQKEEELIEIPKEEPVIQLVFGTPETMTSPLTLKNVRLGYDKKTVLNIPSLGITGKEKIGLLGRNGQGKTTLLRFLAKKMEAQSGQVVQDPRVKIGYFSQELSDELDPTLSVATQFMNKTGITKEVDVRAALSQYGFSHDKINVLTGELSGGEKSRLMFCIICARSPGLIILDEPTNHLDLETRDELICAIKRFTGNVILVSHDYDLLEKTMDKFWLVGNGTVREYEKGLVPYKTEIARLITMNLPTNAAQAARPNQSGFWSKSSATSSTKGHVPNYGA